MSRPLSESKPGLVARAKNAKRELAYLATLLTNTSGSHATVSSDLSTAQSDVDTLITAINAL